jgi:hypothetical protein
MSGLYQTPYKVEAKAITALRLKTYFFKSASNVSGG